MTKYKKIDLEIEKRGYVWQCRPNPANRKYRGKAHRQKIGEGEDKYHCGIWNPIFTRKWARRKSDPRWQGKCVCGLKKQLNLGEVLPESPNYYESKEEAVRRAQELNEQEEHRQAIRSQHNDKEDLL